MGRLIKILSSALMCALFISIATITSDAAEKTVKLGEIFSGQIGESREDVYKINVPTTGTVTFTYNYKMSSYNRFIVMDEYDNMVIYLQLGEGKHNTTLNLMSGNYKVIVRQYMGDPQLQYTVTSKFSSSEETVKETPLNKNDDEKTASTYKVSEEYVGQLSVNDDIDVYKMTIKKNGYLKINLNSKLQNMGLIIKNSKGKVLYEKQNIKAGKRSYSRFCTKGTYYISFISKETGNYDFKIVNSGIPTTKISKIKNVKTRKMSITWTRKSKVNGYKIQYSTNKSFKKGNKTVVIAGNKKNTRVFSKLKKNKKYYVRISTYVKDSSGKIYYSKWSAKKSIKIRK